MNEDDLRIYHMRNSGMSLAEIGEEEGLDPSEVTEILLRFVRGALENGTAVRVH